MKKEILICDICGKKIEPEHKLIKDAYTMNFDICSYECSTNLQIMINNITENVRAEFQAIDFVSEKMHHIIMNMDLNKIHYHNIFSTELSLMIKDYKKDYEENRIRFQNYNKNMEIVK